MSMYSICIKGRNVDVDKFLEFIVAIAQNHQGWIGSGIFFQDVIEFAKINKIPMHTRSKTERTRFMVKHLIQDIQLYFIPRLKQLYPEKMEELLKEKEKNSLGRSLDSELQVKKVSLESFNKRHIKILERVLGREFDLSPREEKELTSLGINVKVLQFSGENSDSYQAQMIRIRQKLAFLKMKFSS